MTEDPKTLDQRDAARLFSFFTEIGIINQLSMALFAKSLPDGVHPSHFSILNHLVRTGDGITPIRIAGAMQVTKTTMTHSLKVLTERGFITTGPNPEDARGKLVYLTEAGRAFRDAAIQSVVGMFGHLLEPEHYKIMEELGSGLEVLRKFLDENRM
ncbi:Transcriptional regulator, MarR family [Candidatus Rhodobacter oscarellae]|uniref:Transcriptional regulator, MarR family n=1 Tax=Candidatus Rhodobacter oscarellae TaxID=1675527 RepID=A0A0J9EBJ7_9RHOB|nr:MarR family winged helix-turn-helix transcriptional regulator [Candidatus Rhodobacter lobularis]KMW59074.1 Transcriptional regulator, MarR family [Candidatus Rhodobacter lobularis]